MALHFFVPTNKSTLADSMGEVLREAAKACVIPRFRALDLSDIREKSPGDLVTTADREAEAMIAARLSALLPSARIVGEEACEGGPDLLTGLSQGEVWIIDPIDGTGNYTAGRAPFAMMAALLREGDIVASAILNPLEDRLFLAEQGAGAWINGERVGSTASFGVQDTCLPSTNGSGLTGIVSQFQFPPEMEAAVIALARNSVDILPTKRCAGFEYPLIATGNLHFALYWRTLAWDHTPGVLLVEQAGGKVAHPDGSAYRPGESHGPLLIAHNEAIWEQIAAALQR